MKEAESESLDLARDFSDSQRWHDEYGSIPRECEDYAAIFPDDPEIPRVDEVLQVIDEYPRLDNEPDDIEDLPSQRSFSSSSDGDIRQIFSDL